MITLIIKQRIILAHIDGMSNRAIANLLHLSKDTVNKYVNEYNEKREELLRMNPDMDTSEIIQAFIEKPTYDSSNRIPSKATPELLEAVEKCLQLNVCTWHRILPHFRNPMQTSFLTVMVLFKQWSTTTCGLL